MVKILFWLSLSVVGWLFLNEGHFSARPVPPLHLTGQESVVLYATTWCGYCAKARRFFAENHIPYQELDVENSDEGRKAYQRLGGGGVPIIVINGSQVIRGFDPEAIAEALAAGAAKLRGGRSASVRCPTPFPAEALARVFEAGGCPHSLAPKVLVESAAL